MLIKNLNKAKNKKHFLYKFPKSFKINSENEEDEEEKTEENKEEEDEEEENVENEIDKGLGIVNNELMLIFDIK